MKRLLTVSLVFMLAFNAWAQSYKQVNDISYTTKTDPYAVERLKLDIYYPEGKKDCPVIVWFHGGGLEAGSKEIPARLKEKGLVVVGVNYRLLPKVTVAETLDDAAEAVAWVFKHIEAYGGDRRKMVVTGHSAGGYLSMMLCLNKAWLSRYGEDADSVMLYVPFSGQAVTHYNVRKMQGIGLYGRYDENQYLARMMKLAGHQQTYLYEIDGHDHGSMVDPSFHILERHLKQCLSK